MFLSFMWIICVMGTIIIAHQKNLGMIPFLLLSLFLAPLALVIAILSPSRKNHISHSSFNQVYGHVTEEIQDLKNKSQLIQNRIERLEELYFSCGEEANQEKSIQPDRNAVQIDPEEDLKFGSEKKIEHVNLSLSKKKFKKSFHAEVKNKEQVGLEARFGKYWLNKIGIAVFMLGVGSLMIYSAQYFNVFSHPFTKIIIGYLLSGGLFLLGQRYEKVKRFRNFGFALLGGAWALTYFTTYAMYHFEASRIIPNQWVDICLLFVVAGGMIKHALKYKSEQMTAVALIMAYVTTTISDISIFSFFGMVGISIVLLILVYRFQWHRVLTMGIVTVYGIHQLWIVPKIHGEVYANIVFLSIYWLMFSAGLHLLKLKDERIKMVVAAMNAGNFILYSLFAYPIVVDHFNAYKFFIVLTAGVFYVFLAACSNKLGRKELHTSDWATALFALTMSIPLRWEAQGTHLLWLMEVPLLIYIGFYCKQQLYRFIGYILSVLCVGWQFEIGRSLNLQDPALQLFNFHLSHFQLVYLATTISFFVAFLICEKLKYESKFRVVDQLSSHFFSAVALLSFNVYIDSVCNSLYFESFLGVQALILYTLGLRRGYQRLCVYAYILLVFLLAMIMLQTTHYIGVSKWILVSFNIAVYFILYFFSKNKYSIQEKNDIRQIERVGFFIGGGIALLCSLFHYLETDWLSLVVGLISVVYICVGLWRRDRLFRLGGFIFIALTVLRIVFIDLAGLNILLKIFSFIVLGVLFLGVSYIYNKIDLKEEDE